MSKLIQGNHQIFCIFLLMTECSEHASDEEDWVIVESPKEHKTFWQGCKNNGKRAFKYYERAKLLYNVYRMVRFIINIYILYHTFHPLSVF